MINRRRQFLSMATTGLALATLPGRLLAAPASYGIKGDYAPELKVNTWIDAAGKATGPFRLADHEGKWIMLKCFQSWCPGCHSHGLPAVQKISGALKDNPKIVFAGIQTVFEGRTINTEDKVRKTQLQYDLHMPMGHDTGSVSGRPFTMIDYRTGGTPWIILIDPQRRVIFNDYGIDADQAIKFLSTQTT